MPLKSIRFNLNDQADRELFEWLKKLPHGDFSDKTKIFWVEEMKREVKGNKARIESEYNTFHGSNEYDAVTYLHFKEEAKGYETQWILDELKEAKSGKVVLHWQYAEILEEELNRREQMEKEKENGK